MTANIFFTGRAEARRVSMTLVVLTRNRVLIEQRRSCVNYKSINFRKKFGLFDEQWRPKVVAEMNNDQFKVVKSKAICALFGFEREPAAR